MWTEGITINFVLLLFKLYNHVECHLGVNIICFIFKKMFENRLLSSEILRGAPSTSYILDVKSDFKPLKKTNDIQVLNDWVI